MIATAPHWTPRKIQYVGIFCTEAVNNVSKNIIHFMHIIKVVVQVLWWKSKQENTTFHCLIWFSCFATALLSQLMIVICV